MATNQQRREAAKRKLDAQRKRRQKQAERRRTITIVSSALAVVVVAGLVVWLVEANSGGSSSADPAASSSPSPTATPPLQIPTQRAPLPKQPKPLANPTSCEYKTDSTPGSKAPKKVNLPDGKNVSSSGTVNVDMKSGAGDIGLTLDRSLAPCTVNSFVSLVKQGFFTNTICHRLGTQDGLQMLQCGDPSANGDPSADGTGGPGYTIPDEVFPQLTYGRGLIAMANTGQPNTGGSQFFLMYGSTQLSPQYTVFGSITDGGLQVLDKVARDGVGTPGPAGDGTGEPKTPVKFSSVTAN